MRILEGFAMFNLTPSRRLKLLMAVVAILLAALILWPDRTKEGTIQGEWTCSMHPQVRMEKPGQCPICGMNLIPVSQQSDLAETEKRAGIETEPVKSRELHKEVRAVGKLDYNESRVAYITARITGRVDHIYADFTGIQVKKGDHLVDIYSPDLFIAQGEYLRALDSSGRPYLESIRTKLRLLGILQEQLDEIEKTRKISTYLTIYAPIGGTVIEKSVRSGQYINEGDMLYRIADLDPIWLYMDIYESDLGWVRFGQAVEVTIEAYPAETFHGIVTFIDPFLDDKTRTVRARVNLKNPDRKLKPAMYATALIRVKLLPDGTPEPTGLEGKYICQMHPEIVQDKPGRCPICGMQLERVPDAPRPAAGGIADREDSAGETKQGKKPEGLLAIRASAVLDTGKRKVAYRQREGGTYELVELALGPRAKGKDDAGQTAEYFPVLEGLAEGDRVAVRGGFLLDSQQQISGMPSLLYDQGQSASNLHSGHGAPAQPSAPSGHKH
jgi:Cu(I)/Ag(I) efflux system membrane fusion protein